MPGELSIVLHTHMPYVEGYGTWPFGEEWLWEAIATSYVPLLDVLDEAAGDVTLSLTPVLCDQLEADGVDERLTAFLTELRPLTHRLDADDADEPAVAAELERSAGDYAQALAAVRRLGGASGLLSALGGHATWTSSATHAILPLLATDAGVHLQVESGITAHRARFGEHWGGGFWLPECAHAAPLDPLLAEHGVRACCVDLTDVFGLGARQHLTPLDTGHDAVLVPIDRALIELVWSDRGYPADPAYRSSHAMTRYRHRPWANDGGVYNRARAQRAAREHAAAFAARARDRVRDGGLAVVALDTELLGHHWFEGPIWLRELVRACRADGPRLRGLDAALADHRAAARPTSLPTTTWGTPRDLSTWSGPAVAEIAWSQRAAELELVAAADAPRDAIRQLLALQSSDWAFLVSHDLAAPYGRERAAHHRAMLGEPIAPAPRNLGVHAAPLHR